VTLKEALLLAHPAETKGEPFRALLACGYSPLHLRTFLAAHLTRALPGRAVSVTAGLYGNLPGTLASVADAEERPHAIALSFEWSDLDPRLGYRRLGGWAPGDLSDVVESCRSQLQWLARSLESLPSGIAVAVAGPTLPPAPVAQTPGWMASVPELELRAAVHDFLLQAARQGRRVLDSGFFDRASSPEQRFDARSELSAGFPFTREHAAELAGALAKLILPDTPKKGLITDLDDTLWKGIVGEIGAEAVAWDLDSGGQIHGLYQQLLASLSRQGTLLAIASKNDLSNVTAAFERGDIRVPMDAFFPVEVHWNPKSGSIRRILETWNIGGDAVVFLDDSPAELGEVQAAHPEIECILFPKNDPAAAIRLLAGLRDRFGKAGVGAEDAIRLQSVRRAVELREVAESDDALDRFLASANGKVTVDVVSGDARTLELVNKTNQFNLNGARYTEADWDASRGRPGAFTLSLSYEDKFGPLGKIAVLHGAVEGDTAQVDVWVMSCRAFSRRIEYHTVQALFDRFPVEQIRFRFQPTSKNGPIATLLRQWLGDPIPSPAVLEKSRFLQKIPALDQQVSYVQ
jgi:FkbH-like protein